MRLLLLKFLYGKAAAMSQEVQPAVTYVKEDNVLITFDEKLAE